MIRCCLYILVMSFTVFSCTVDKEWKDSAVHNEMFDKDGNVMLHFMMHTSDIPEVNTRAVDPDGYGIGSLWLFCFDEGRHYVGRVRASVNMTEQTENALRGSFRAKVSGSVRYLHFIANANVADFDDARNLGRLDTEIIPELTSTSGLLVYWGFRKFADRNELAAFASGKGTEVSLLRNQARIRYRRTSAAGNLSIKGMAILNQYAVGTVAPLRRNRDELFEFGSASEIERPTLCADEDKVAAVPPSDVMRWGSERTGFFVFEHENTFDNQMFLIFRISTSGGERQDGEWTAKDRYYKIAIIDRQGNHMPILRNHDYVIQFNGLPEMGGYATFKEAVNGTASNNVWVSIEQSVPFISDGRSTLSVIGETTQIITEKSLGSDGTYQIGYTWYDATSSRQISPEVTWIQNTGIADTEIVNRFEPGTSGQHGRGRIIIRPRGIGAPQQGLLQIKAGKFIRAVKLISLANFSFVPVWTSSGMPERAGETVTLFFTVPDDYPKELLPLDVKIACNLFSDNGTNVDMKGENAFLDVLVEECNFEVNEGSRKVTYKRDWPHKYVYSVNRTGLHKVNFKTLVNDYTPRSGEESRIEFFLEAEAFATVRSLVRMNSDDTGYRLELGVGEKSGIRWVLPEDDGIVELSPVADRNYHFHFRLRDGNRLIRPNPGEVFRVYMDVSRICPLPGVSALGSEPLFDRDKGYYYLYTVPAALPRDYEQRGIAIPVKTLRPDYNTYLRVASMLEENGTPSGNSRAYRSAVMYVKSHQPYHLGFSMEGNSGSTSVMDIGYGPQVPVRLNVEIPQEVLDESPEGVDCLIRTSHLVPSGNETKLNKTDGGYWFRTRKRRETFRMETNAVASSEILVLSGYGQKILFDEARVEIRNRRISGRLRLPGGESFDRMTPFISLERNDGTRIGVLEVMVESGGNEAAFTVDLRTEYKLNMNEQIYIRYVPLTAGDRRVFRKDTSLKLLQDFPLTVIELEKVK